MKYSYKKCECKINIFNFFSETRELRFSHDICDEEKEFLKKRSEVLLKKFSKLDLGEKTPRNKNEVNKYTLLVANYSIGLMAGIDQKGHFCI